MTGEWLEASVIALGWTLLHFIWQGALIDLTHARLLAHFDESRAQARYLTGLVALLLLVVTPPVTFRLVFETPGAVDNGLIPLTGVAASSITITGMSNPGPLETLNYIIETTLPYMVILWGIGVLVYMIRMAIGMHAISQLARSADYTAIPRWLHQELAHLLLRMRVTQKVQLALSTMVNAPLVIGWIRPVILLPLTALTGLDRDQLRMVLIHEIAHIRRLDHLVNLIQVVVETLLFYHPGVHRISRRLRAERERCCDDAVGALHDDRIAYARLLAELEENRHVKSESALSLGMIDSELYGRINRLIGPAVKTRTDQTNWLFFCMLLTILIVLGIPKTIDALWKPQAIAISNFAPQLSAPKEQSTDPATQVAQASLAPSEIHETKATSGKPGVITQSVPQPQTQKLQRDRKPAPVQTQAIATRDEIVTDIENLSAPEIENNLPATTVNKTTEAELLTTKPATAQLEPANTGGELIYVVKPDYPRKALRRHIEGEVVLSFIVTEEGKVKSAEVIHARPSWIFDAAAIAAVSQWRYSPFRENGNVISQRVTLPIEFRLDEINFSSSLSGATRDCVPETGTRICTDRDRNIEAVQLEIMQN